jgi:hypothetical protein
MDKLKNILIKLNDWKFGILIIIFIGGFFYWFQVRPSRIYSLCNKSALNSVKTLSNPTKIEYDFLYESCLRNKGLNK